MTRTVTVRKLLVENTPIVVDDEHGDPYDVGSVSIVGSFGVLLSDNLEGVVRTNLNTITIRIVRDDEILGDKDTAEVELDVAGYVALRDALRSLEAVLPDEWKEAGK